MKKYIQFLLALVLSSLFLFGANNALSFDGSEDYVEINSLTTPLSSVSSFTIECWFNGDDISSSTGNQILWGINGPTSNPNTNIIMFAVHGDVIKVYDGNATGYTATTIIEQNNWYHIAFVKSSDNSFIVYLNGVEELTGSQITPIPSGNTFSIGQEWDSSPSDLFDGKIDEFRVWSDVRTETEIRQNMYRELNGNESGLIAYYKFNETSGTTADNAEGTSSYDGTLMNMTGSEWQTSSAIFGPNNCIEMDGSEDYVNCEFIVNPSTLSALTLECWVNVDVVDHYNRIFAQDYIDASDAGCAWLALNLDGTAYSYFGGSLQDSEQSVTQNEWTHIVMVWDGTTIYYYFNGKLDPNTYAVASLASSDNDLYLGWSGNQINTYFDGKIDEIRIWNDARTADEIREYMFKNLTGNEANLVAYYNFDNTTGDKLQDFSGNGNDGTLNNMDDADWVASSAFNTWLNTSSSSWSTASNWSNGSIPSSTDNVGIFNLDTEPNISGSPTFSSLYLGSGISTVLNSGMTINASLILDEDLDLNGQTITLGSFGTLIENAGQLTGSSGTITTTRSLSNINENVAGLGAEITEDGDLGSTTITRGHAAQGSAGIKRYYHITPTNSPSNASLVFHYEDSELNGQTESELKLYKSTDGESWTEQTSTVNTSNNTLTMTGINSFSWWTAAPSGSEGALPIELSTFTADIQDGQVELSWQTASETNNAAFLVYRNDKVIARIEGAGTTSETHTYSYVDATVVPDLTYTYVLADVDYANNETKYENDAVTVTLANDVIEADFMIGAAYPNPFNPTAIVPLELARDAVVNAKVYTLAGHEIATLVNGTMNAGSHELRINANNMTTGLYLVKVMIEDVVHVQKIAFVK